MEHIAIMRNSWGLLDKIISGNKTIESRWYNTKYPPWGRIRPGDTLYFKDSGKPVSVKSRVDKVSSYSDLWPEKVLEILNEFGHMDGLGLEDIPTFFQMFKHKKYCILIFFSKVELIDPFNIDKSGYGMMSSWIIVNDINNIKIFSSSNVKQHQHLIGKYL